MARERWFYEQDNERRGPFSLDTLVDALRTLPEPRNCLVWKHGMPAWTLAAEVPEIEQLLPTPAAAAPPVTAPPQSPFYTSAPAAADSGFGGVAVKEPTTGRFAAPVESRFGTATVARPPFEAEPSRGPMMYVLGAAALIVIAGGVGWALLSRSAPPERTVSAPPGSGTSGPAGAPSGARPEGAAPPSAAPGAAPGGGTTSAATPPAGATATKEPAAARSAPATDSPKAAGFAGWSDTELPLPSSELGKLRGVAGWSGNNLSITLYNGCTWRVTELVVRTSRLEGDKFVDAPTPSLLLPVTEQIDTGIADILRRVAPDRRKPGINPLDTGAFEAKVGPQPEAYRWKIEGAKGYPPRGES